MQDTSEIAPAGHAGAGWVERIARAQRRQLFEAFLRFRHGPANDSVLSLSLGKAAGGLQQRADAPTGSLVSPCILTAGVAPRLPYGSNSFDWIYCAEVIEHLTPAAWQQLLVSECFRVARKGVFITTPNRRHPIEFHSGVPMLHWLPARWRSSLSRVATRVMHIPPALVDAPCLYEMASILPGAPVHDVGHKRVLGIKAHFFLMIRKGD